MKNNYVSKEMRIITIFFIVTSLFIFLIDGVSQYHIDTLHKLTKNIYDHPLKVSNAALNVQKGVVKIHRDMKDVVLFYSKDELNSIIQRIDEEEKNVYSYLKIIELNILGEEGMLLYKKTYELFKEWRKIRDKVIKLVDEKRLFVGVQITKNEGALHVAKLEKSAILLNKYAHNKADNFQQKANLTFEKFQSVSLILTILILAVLLVFVLYIRKRIQNNITLISDNKDKFEALNERFEIAISGSQDGLWDWNVETNEVYFTPRWKEMLGYKDSELKNEFQTWIDKCHEDDIEQANKDIEYSQSKEGRLYQNIHRLKHKNGFWVWILARGRVIFNKSGKVVRMVGFHTDITEQKKLEHKLLSAKIEFDRFMHFIPANILIKDKNGVIIYANDKSCTFFGQENIIGKTARDLLPTEKAKEQEKFDEMVIQQGTFEELKEFYNAQNSLVVIRILGFSLKVDGEIQVGLVMLDITESYLDKKELQNKEEIMIAQSRHAAMGEMISMIAHQWRQPISVIAMDANNVLVDLELDTLDNEELFDILKDIISQTQELSKTIDDFRGFFEPNKNAEDILFKEIINNALNVIGKSLENSNIKLNLKGDESIKVTTFARELMQVVINIIKNAKDILLEREVLDKQISIDFKLNEDYVFLSICDNGGGIDEKIISKVFEPYFSTKSEKNGTGLGLYMSKIIIEKHLKGIITVSNENDGACFKIELPLNLDEIISKGVELEN